VSKADRPTSSPRRPPKRSVAAGGAPGRLPHPPDPDTVIGESVLVSPRGARYRVIKTTQTDATDAPAPRQPGGKRKPK